MRRGAFAFWVGFAAVVGGAMLAGFNLGATYAVTRHLAPATTVTAPANPQLSVWCKVERVYQ